MCSQLTRFGMRTELIRKILCAALGDWKKRAFDFILMCVHSTASSIGLSFFAARSQLPKEQNSEGEYREMEWESERKFSRTKMARAAETESG